MGNLLYFLTINIIIFILIFIFLCSYKTLGPLAKLCNTKTIKQRRIMYNRLETKLLINSNVNNNNNSNNNSCNCSNNINICKSNNTINKNSNKHCQRFIQSETNLIDNTNYNDCFLAVNK